MSEPKGLFDGAQVIYAYTRKQAIEDGVLVDVSQAAREAGFRYHTVLTEGAWSEAVSWDAANGSHQDEKGRLWDVLMMARNAIRRAIHGDDRVDFKVSVLRPTPKLEDYKDEIRETVSLYIHIGPGDTPGPVFTIMLIGED